MKGLVNLLYAAGIVSIGTLGLWAVNDLWKPLVLLALCGVLLVLLLRPARPR